MANSPDDQNVSEFKEWDDSWRAGRTAWHLKDVNPLLVENIHYLTRGREHLKVLIPLCGKSVDINWLADKGHTVVGVEMIVQAVEDFFMQFDISYTVVPVEACKGSLYKSVDGNIKIYCCDFLDFNSSLEGLFDAIWDRGSIEAIPRNIMKPYSELILSLMAPECQYLIESFEYDPAEKNTAPFFIPEEEFNDLFGHQCNIQKICSADAGFPKERFKLSWMNVILHHMHFKDNSS